MIDSLVVTVNYYHEVKKERKLEHSALDLEVRNKP